MVSYVASDKIAHSKKERGDAYNTEICLGKEQIKAIEMYLAKIPAQSKILEIGPGGGHLSNKLSQRFDIYCADADNYLNKAYTQLQKKFKKVNLSYDKYPYKKEEFDGVLATEVIEHLENLAWCFIQVNTILKKDGWFLFTIPNISNYSRRMHFLTKGDNLLISDINDHVQNITPSLIRKMVATHFDKGTTIQRIPYRVTFPLLRFKIPHMHLLADNCIYLIKK